MDKIITRFAPSPTGFLHLGGARTALFAFLVARQKGGEFLLRIEDTDTKRNKADAYTGIIESLKWLGLNHDGTIVYQSKNKDLYHKYLQKLFDAKKCYVCECSEKRLEELKEEQTKNKTATKYDGRCRDKNLAYKPGAVVRFKQDNVGTTEFFDEVYKQIVVNNSELDDWVILKSDTDFTYNFACVVDDTSMGVNFIVRGNDHLNNTPKQINLQSALGMAMPKYAHLPMLLNEDGKKLSKRYDSVDVREFAKKGFLKEAMINYLALLGCSFANKELLSLKELINEFEIEKVHVSNARFSIDKLNWINKQYLKNFDSYLSDLYEYFLQYQPSLTKEHLSKALEAFSKRVNTLAELKEKIRFLYDNEFTAKFKPISDKELQALETFVQMLEKHQYKDAKDVSLMIKSVCKEHPNVAFKDIAMNIRYILSGESMSIGVGEMLILLPFEQVLGRLRKYFKLFSHF